VRKIHYGGGAIIVSDEIGKAVLRYARALAHAKTADLIVVPGLTEDNQVGVAHLLIGPASQLLSVPAADLDIDLADARVVEILEARTKNADPDRPEWGSDIVDVSDFTKYDWDF